MAQYALAPPLADVSSRGFASAVEQPPEGLLGALLAAAAKPCVLAALDEWPPAVRQAEGHECWQGQLLGLHSDERCPRAQRPFETDHAGTAP